MYIVLHRENGALARQRSTFTRLGDVEATFERPGARPARGGSTEEQLDRRSRTGPAGNDDRDHLRQGTGDLASAQLLSPPPSLLAFQISDLQRQQAVAISEVESTEVNRLRAEVVSAEAQLTERNKVPVSTSGFAWACFHFVLFYCVPFSRADDQETAAANQ